MEDIPSGCIHVTDLRYRSSPYPTLDCTVPGLSQEAFDRNWQPKATSLMCIDSVTRKYVIFRPLSASKSNADTHTSTNEEREAALNSSSNTENNNPSEKVIPRAHEGKIVSSIAEMTQSKDADDNQTFIDWRRLSRERMAFGSATEFTMSRALYDPDVPKGRLDFRFTLAYVGSCTVTHRTEFFALGKGGSKVRLWSNTYQLVMVDKETRQPTKVPQWFLDEYQGRGCTNQPLVIRPFRKPSRTYCHPVLVQWSDTDEFGHATWSSYVHWAIDGLHAALLSRPTEGGSKTTDQQHQEAKSAGAVRRSDTPKRAGAVRGSNALRGITSGTLKRGLAKFQTCYFKECLEGERVEVHIWQEGEAEEVFCSILRAGEEVSQVKLVYFTDEDEEEEGF